LNGAGEIAVRAFLDGRIAFLEIAEIIESVLQKTERVKPNSYLVLQETDTRARALAKEYVAGR
jgi:1-deoxy-D-xylulose-5-phosphate reductoisomerase